MRVLHVAETIRGGIAAVLRPIVTNQLESLGRDSVKVIVPATQAEDLFSVPLYSIVSFDRRGRNARSLLALRATLCREIKHFRPDILHLHSSFAGLVGQWR
jgi:hypothetical protein